MSHTLKFNFDSGEYFSAYTSSGGIRVGMNGAAIIEFPPGHARFPEALSLTPDTIEAFIDAQVEAGRIDIRVFT